MREESTLKIDPVVTDIFERIHQLMNGVDELGFKRSPDGVLPTVWYTKSKRPVVAYIDMYVAKDTVEEWLVVKPSAEYEMGYGVRIGDEELFSNSERGVIGDIDVPVFGSMMFGICRVMSDVVDGLNARYR